MSNEALQPKIRYYILQYPNPIRAYVTDYEGAQKFMLTPAPITEALTSIVVRSPFDLVGLNYRFVMRAYRFFAGMEPPSDKLTEMREALFSAITQKAVPLARYKPAISERRMNTENETLHSPDTGAPQEGTNPNVVTPDNPDAASEKPKRTMKRGTPDAPLAVRRDSKIGNVFMLLEKPEGATAEEILVAFGEDLKDTSEATTKRVEGYLLESWIRKEKGYTWNKSDDGKYTIDQPVVWTGAGKAAKDASANQDAA